MHFVRDVIEKGDVKVMKVGIEDNPADMLTKVLPIAKFKHCLNIISCLEA